MHLPMHAPRWGRPGRRPARALIRLLGAAGLATLAAVPALAVDPGLAYPPVSGGTGPPPRW